MSEGGWIDFASSRKARVATIVLLTVQLGGCLADLVTEQASLMAGFCTAAPDRSVIGMLAGFIWFVLAFSWVAGLLALRLPPLRPAYWALLLAIIPASVAQSALIERQLLFCDAP